MSKTLTFALMDAPYESARTTTAMRLMHLAAERGYHLKVFAYEGAVYLPFTKQQPHGNAVHGHDVHEENHPVSHQWVAQLFAVAAAKGGSVDWVNCGLCVDERGAHEATEGVRRGGPAHFLEFAQASDNTLVIGTRS